jgi:putative transposase
MSQRGKYSDEFKREAVQLTKHPGDSKAQIARELRINPNTKRVTDTTYMETRQGWLYLCVVLDLYHGLTVGWSMSNVQDRQLALQAVLMARWQHKGSEVKYIRLH